MIDYGNRSAERRQDFDDEITDEITKILRRLGRARDISFVVDVADAVEGLARLRRSTFSVARLIARAAVDRALERERLYGHDTGAQRRRWSA